MKRQIRGTLRGFFLGILLVALAGIIVALVSPRGEIAWGIMLLVGGIAVWLSV